MEEQLIKSKKRVQQHGEVFTPSWMVQKMLDTPGVKEACESIEATFLEPAAGDGNFLEAILERKLQAVMQRFDKKYWKTKSLFALSSIYGIEFLEDNVDVARSRLFLHYIDWYQQAIGEKLSNRSNIYKSARYLISKNIVRGNTLTKRHPDTNDLIFFNEWKRVKGSSSKVEKIPFAFAELFDEGTELESSFSEGQLSLFDLDGDFIDDIEVMEISKTSTIAIQKVYLLGD